MLSEVRIQIGMEDESTHCIDDICDRWVRERITGLRKEGRDSRFKLSFEYKGRTYAFATPGADHSANYVSSDPHFEILSEINHLWHLTGLNTPAYTASAVIHFLRKFRQYLSA